MVSVSGYFDGKTCVPTTPFDLNKVKINQKVIITILDDTVSPKKRVFGTLENKGKVTFSDDFKITDEELLGVQS